MGDVGCGMRGDWERGDKEMAAELGAWHLEHQTSNIKHSPPQKTHLQPINKKLFYQFGSLDKYYFIVF